MDALQSYPQHPGKRKSGKKRQRQQQLGPRQAAFKQSRPQQHLGNLGPYFGGTQQRSNLGPYIGATQQPPSLEDMRAANKQRTHHHFSGRHHLLTGLPVLVPLVPLAFGFMPVPVPRFTGPRQKFRRQPRNPPKSIPRAPDHPHTTAFPPGR
jgi:hypothetical protein